MRRTSSLIHAANLFAKAAAPSRRSIDGAFERLHDKAVKGSGNTVDLDAAVLDGYRFLLRSFDEAPRLSALGWFLACSDLQARMENEMRIERLHRDVPEIGKERIERPIIIVGLPRTGTTVTHKVFSQSTAHRGPALWELMHTNVALPDKERAKILKQINTAMRLIPRLAPAMRQIHPQRAEGADEDPFVLTHGAQHLARAPMRKYEDWCYERDYTADYEFLRRVYQVLQYGREPKRWVLKSPTHLANLDKLVRVFPDAKILWLHRDPVTVMGSICSLIETSQLMHVHRPDLEEIGKMCMRQLPWMVERARTARLGLPREQIVDVPYHWIASDPRERFPEIYRLIGAEWTPLDDGNLEKVMARPSGRPHEYGIGRYGLRPADVERAFGDYAKFELKLPVK